MMKKLLAVAMLLAAVANVEAGFFGGRCGKNRNCSPCKTEVRECAPTNCLRPACIVECTNNVCEGEKPQLCALEPARVDLIKDVNTTISYRCAGRKGCQVVPTQEQVEQLIAGGHIPADTISCGQ
jgi:hypothetical protein